MPEKGFDLGDYIEVKDRIRVLYDLYGTARIVTTYELTREPDDKPKVISRALVYRTPEDEHPATGTSWLYLPGTTPYTRGSEIENAETSAVGRAIGMLGILIDRSIASANEIESKAGGKAEGHTAKPDPERAPLRADEPELIGPFSGTGQLGVNPKPPADGFLRQEPDGAIVIVTFTDTDNHKIPQVMVRGALAVDLIDAAAGELKGLVCTIEGELYRVPWFKDAKPMPAFQRLELRRISTAGFTLPVPGQTGPGLFDDATEAELDAALP